MRKSPRATASPLTIFLLLLFAIGLVPQLEGRAAASPADTLRQLEMKHRGANEEVHIGNILTLHYAANAIAAESRYLQPLIELAEALKAEGREHYRIVVRGYTDVSGDPDGNRRLSLQRAEALKDLLAQHPSISIAKDRIRAEGLGEKDPIAPNTTPEGRIQNRRVEIHLYGEVGAAPGNSYPAAAARAKDGIRPERVHLSLLDAIRYGMEGNQEIQVVSFTPERAKEELSDAESVYDPEFFADSRFRRDPNLQSSVTRVVMEDDGLLSTGIRKPLPTGGSLSGGVEMRYGDLINSEFDRTYKYTFAPLLEIRQPLLKNIGAKEEKSTIKIAHYELDISEEDFRQKAIEIAARISRTYWQLYLLREFVAIDRENLKMADEVYRRERVRVTEGLSQPLDVERARSNAQSRRSRLLQSRQRLQVAMNQLKLAMNWANLTIDSSVAIVPTEVPKTAPIEIEEQAAIETALRNRPEVRKAGRQVDISRVEESLYRHRRLPKLDVFGRYAVAGYGDEFSNAFYDTAFNQEDYWAVGLNFAYPIGNRSAEARSRLKIVERRQSEAQVDRIRSQIKQDVKEVLLSIAFSRGEIESNRTAMESAAKVVDGEFARFEIGQTTNEELLRAQDLLAATSRNHVRALVDYSIAKAELKRALGNLPEGVSIGDASR